MSFITKNFNVDQGSTFTFSIIWKDGSDAPIDVTGYSAKMQARDSQGGKILAFTLTHTDGIVVGGSNGTISVTISPDRTNKLIFPKTFYDILITSPSGVKTRILEGVITPNRAVTV